MAETPNVCPALHMPLQSGSDRMLKAMRRSYRAERYLGIIDRVRAAMPHAAITTDLIVGFPGETEEDFQATLDVVRRARFASAFTFQYSKRPGTPAAELPDQLPKEVVQERYERLIALQERDLADGEPRTGRPHRRTARRRGGGSQGRRDRADERPGPRRPAGALRARRAGRSAPVTWSTTTVTDAAPHHLIADGGVLTHRRTRAGDAHEAGRRPAPSAWACRAWANPTRCRPPPGAHGDVLRHRSSEGFDAYRDEIESAERRVAREIEPGPRALVVAILVFVLLVSFVLPHTGDARGVDVLMGNQTAIDVGIALPSRVFCWLTLVFGVGFSMLALLTRRWALAWVALAGSWLASATGLLAVWSRQTAPVHAARPGRRAWSSRGSP